MNPHPSTLAFLQLVASRPGMFMHDFDLKDLELQLYGYDAALGDVGVRGNHDRFNVAFVEYLRRNHHLSCSNGWARALLEKFGSAERAYAEFGALVEQGTSNAHAANRDAV